MALSSVVTTIDELSVAIRDAFELHDIAKEEDDITTLEDLIAEVQKIEWRVANLEFQRMF